MKQNLNSIDRIIRLVIAAVAAFLFFNGTLTGGLGIAALVVAVVLALTSLVSFCPIYAMLGLSSRRVEKAK